MPRASRKPEILQALARMLESNPGGKITTAKLAQEVGLSEAALYRHFPSKAKMIEGLIEFIEDTLFSRMSIIAKEPRTHEAKCHDIA
ncbi:MAG TPA: nucleoid occlusion factor SlmA, partial [Gammaproteobacteria bacterium]|nr:nucleoid occlusion factor SlmA [Gammaproteobacteria bacterium]